MIKKEKIGDIIIHDSIDRNYKKIIATNKKGELIAIDYNFKRIF